MITYIFTWTKRIMFFHSFAPKSPYSIESKYLRNK